MKLVGKFLEIVILTTILAFAVVIGLGSWLSYKVPYANNKYDSIVRLVRDGKTFCSGTVINAHTIVTAAHCILVPTPFGYYVLYPGPIEIRDKDDQPLGIIGQAYGASPQLDQGVLEGDFRNFRPRAFTADVKTLSSYRIPGAKFISCGYPQGAAFFCAEIQYSELSDFMWKTRGGTMLPGMSGGPVMLPDGTVIAVNVAVDGVKSVVSPIYNLNTLFKE